MRHLLELRKARRMLAKGQHEESFIALDRLYGLEVPSMIGVQVSFVIAEMVSLSKKYDKAAEWIGDLSAGGEKDLVAADNAKRYLADC